MSRHWYRARFETACGDRQGCRIPTGEPVLWIRGEQGWTKKRCAQHAGEPVNEAHLAEDDAKRAEINRERSLVVQPTSYLDDDKLPFDGKAAAAGDDQ